MKRMTPALLVPLFALLAQAQSTLPAPLLDPAQLHTNRGLGGQTASQMLARFHPNVLNLKPSVVLILMGANDMAVGRCATTSNLRPLADRLSKLSRDAGYEVISPLASAPIAQALAK